MSSPNSSNNNIVGSDKETFCIDQVPSNIFGNCSIIIFSFLFLFVLRLVIQNHYIHNVYSLVLIDNNYQENNNVAWKIFLFLPSTLWILLMNYIRVFNSRRQWEIGNGNQELRSVK